jgi:hypothetical protein
LSPGDTFRLVVITAGSTAATSTSISTYDTFVNTQGLSGITVNGASLTWQAIGLTPASDPLADITRYSSQANASRTYNLNGALVSNTTNGSPIGTVTAALGQSVNYNDYDFGNNQQVPKTLYPYLGRAGARFNGWSAFDNLDPTTLRPMYAMSELITVTAVPEPSTYAMALAGLACGGFSMWRGRIKLPAPPP